MATDGFVALTARLLGAVSLLAVGLVHLQQHQERYSAIPTIGTLFLLSFFGALVVSTLLVLPVERWAGRWGAATVVALALTGICQAATQLVFLAISEQRPLFGFQEPGYDPTAILASRVTEAATVVFLTVFLAARSLRRRTSVREGTRVTQHERQLSDASAQPRSAR